MSSRSCLTDCSSLQVAVNDDLLDKFLIHNYGNQNLCLVGPWTTAGLIEMQSKVKRDKVKQCLLR